VTRRSRPSPLPRSDQESNRTSRRRGARSRLGTWKTRPARDRRLLPQDRSRPSAPGHASPSQAAPSGRPGLPLDTGAVPEACRPAGRAASRGTSFRPSPRPAPDGPPPPSPRREDRPHEEDGGFPPAGSLLRLTAPPGSGSAAGVERRSAAAASEAAAFGRRACPDGRRADDGAQLAGSFVSAAGRSLERPAGVLPRGQPSSRTSSADRRVLAGSRQIFNRRPPGRGGARGICPSAGRREGRRIGATRRPPGARRCPPGRRSGRRRRGPAGG
jgi:hypothetical protein